MLRIIFFTAFVLASTASAFADFVPGRIRLNSSTDLEIYEASGAYSGIKSGVMHELITDGSSKVVYSVSLEKDRVLLTFDLMEKTPSSCGDTIKAQSQDLPGAKVQSELQLVDMSRALCDIYVKDLFTIKVKTTNAVTGEVSEVTMGGNPTYFMHTM